MIDEKTFELFISDELRNILIEFEADSIVAQLLLKNTHDIKYLEDNPPNYIGLSKEDKSKISYLSYERILITDPGSYWRTSKRFICKPGSFISKIFKDISPKEIEKFSTLLRSQLNQTFNFKVISGEEIRKFYSYQSYSPGGGSLNASCMKHDACQEFLNIYTENPDYIKMLVMVDPISAKLMGRAILWDFESYKLMDRIYTINDEELQYHFKKWAIKNGYLHKSEQNWFNTLNFEQIGQKKQELKISIKLPNIEYAKYPYLDTFKFLNKNSGELYNYIPEDAYPSIRTLCAPDGSTASNDYLKFDGFSRVFRSSGDCVFLKYLNIYTSASNTNYSEINETHILSIDCKYDSEIEEYLFNEKYDHLNDMKRIEDKRQYIQERNSKYLEMKKHKIQKNRLPDYADNYLTAHPFIDEMIREIYYRPEINFERIIDPPTALDL